MPDGDMGPSLIHTSERMNTLSFSTKRNRINRQNLSMMAIGVCIVLTCFVVLASASPVQHETKKNEVEFGELEHMRSKRSAVMKGADLTNATAAQTRKDKKQKRRAKKEGGKRRRSKRSATAMFSVGASTPTDTRSSVVVNEPYLSSWRSEIMVGFTLEDGRCVRVPYSGIYYIYSQVMFETQRGYEVGTGLYSVNTNVRNQPPHAICKFSFPNGHDRDEQVTCSLAKLVTLTAGDCLQIKLLPPNVAVYLRGSMTYFGGYLVKAT